MGVPECRPGKGPATRRSCGPHPEHSNPAAASQRIVRPTRSSGSAKRRASWRRPAGSRRGPAEFGAGPVGADREIVVGQRIGGALTSDAGALLLGAVDRSPGPVTRFAGCFSDARASGRTVHAMAMWMRLVLCRTSTATMRANQLRLWFASMAYVMLSALRRLALAGTRLARATCGSIRLKLLKIAARVRHSTRRIHIAMASACPHVDVFARAHRRLCG